MYQVYNSCFVFFATGHFLYKHMADKKHFNTHSLSG